MKVSFAVRITHPDRDEDISFHESVLDAVEDYHSSVLKSACRAGTALPYRSASMDNPLKCWRASSPSKQDALAEQSIRSGSTHAQRRISLRAL